MPKKHHQLTFPYDKNKYALCGNEKAKVLVLDIKDVDCKACLSQYGRRH